MHTIHTSKHTHKYRIIQEMPWVTKEPSVYALVWIVSQSAGLQSMVKLIWSECYGSLTTIPVLSLTLSFSSFSSPIFHPCFPLQSEESPSPKRQRLSSQSVLEQLTSSAPPPSTPSPPIRPWESGPPSRRQPHPHTHYHQERCLTPARHRRRYRGILDFYELVSLWFIKGTVHLKI